MCGQNMGIGKQKVRETFTSGENGELKKVYEHRFPLIQ